MDKQECLSCLGLDQSARALVQSEDVNNENAGNTEAVPRQFSTRGLTSFSYTVL